MQYRAHRYPTDYAVQIRTASGLQRGMLCDVNRSGARVRGLVDIQRGEKLRMNVLSQYVDARVLWANDGQVGVAFRPAIPEHLVDVMRRRADGHRNRHSLGFAYPEMR